MCYTRMYLKNSGMELAADAPMLRREGSSAAVCAAGLLLSYELRGKDMRKLFLALALAAALLAAGCGRSEQGAQPQTVSRPAVESAERQFTAPAAGQTVAVFDTSAGVFKAVLYPDLAPQACENFIGLVNKGYYNGLTITRVEKDFVVGAGQGADGKGTTIWGGSRYPAEYTDRLHHYSGALCAAADAAGECASVFYVVQTLPDSVSQELTDQMTAAGYRAEVIAAYQAGGGAPYLDYGDTVFGQVFEGMETVDRIAQAAVDENQTPVEPITIHSVSLSSYEAAAAAPAQ